MILVDCSEDIGRREYMEDRYCVEPHFHDGWSLFAVYDGHSGHEVSHFLKFHFKDILRQSMMENDDIHTAVDDAFAQVAKTLKLETAIACGSTACILLIKNTTVVSINVGDSRAVMGSTRIGSNTIALTEDHKPDDPVEEERIREAGGFVMRDFMGTARTNGMLAMSRSVGDFFLFPYVVSTPDVKKFDMIDNDIFLLATDGLWDVFSNDDVIDHIRIGAKSKDLIHIAKLRGSSDNITVVMLKKIGETLL